MRILFLIILLSLFWSCEENQIGTLEKTSYKVKFVKPLSSFGSLKDSLENSGRYNALSVAIIRSDTTVTWDYGLANDSSLFRVGSVSKSFTGLSILKLVEEGKVSLNDTLIKLIPELPFSNKFDEPILLKHVLEASAGFVSYRKEDFTSDPGYDTISISKLLLNNPYNFEPSWPPGKYTAYHTVGPFITGYIIEDRSNMRYNDFVSSHFFKPLDMSRSTFFENDEVKNHLINYQDSTFLHLKQRSSGSLITSTRELIPFLQMLINDGIYDVRQILTRESIDRFETATSNLAVNKLDISDGHGINSWSMYYDGIRYQTHPGEIAPRFLAQYGYSRKYRTGFIFMIQGASQGALKVLNRTILPYLEPQIEKPPVNKISVKEENEYLGCYEKIQKTWLTDPAFSIELIRDSTDQLAIRNNNFDDSPHIKPLKHTSRKSIYLDDNPKNNFSINGQTRYALITDEDGEKVIQKISYPWEAYKRIPCDKK